MNGEKALLAASALMGLDVDDPLHHFMEEIIEGDGDEPPEYVFVGSVGRAHVTAKQLIEFRYCDAAITAATGQVVDHLTPKEWRRARRALLAAKTVVRLGEEAGLKGTVRDRLVMELRSRGGYYEREHYDRKEIEEALAIGHPVRVEGRVWISVETMINRLDQARIRYDRRELMRGLLALGCREKRVFTYPKDGHSSGTLETTRARTSRTMYAVPQSVLERVIKKG